jgi:hypothetical protein
VVEAGKEYPGHLLSPNQLALYRVVTRDAGRFPELGLKYQKLVVAGRTEILVAYQGRQPRILLGERNLGDDTSAASIAGLWRTLRSSDPSGYCPGLPRYVWK